MKKKDIIHLIKETINEVGADAYGDATLTSQGQSKSRFTKTGRPPGVMEDENLKEFTDYGQEGIYPKKEKPGDMFQQKEVEDLFPNGMASRSNKEFQARLKQHADWTEQSAYNNTFVHMQYHETKGLEDEYFIYQTQHYNTNYDDFRSPKFTILSITKNKGTEKEEDLGSYIVDTNAYIDDLDNLRATGNLGDRVMESLDEAHPLNKVIGSRPYSYIGGPMKGQYVLSGPMNDSEKETIIRGAEQAGYIAKPNMGGGVTIFIKPRAVMEVKEGVGADLGPGPKAGPDGVKDNYYVKNFKYKLVPKKIKGSGIIVKQLFEDDSKKNFQLKRIEAFDGVEEKLNNIYTMISNAKNETIKYYKDNPDSFKVVKPTDLVMDYLTDIEKITKRKIMKTLQEQYNLIKEGKGHKDVFLKEAKLRYPNLISNVLTYDQATTILKQRSVIKEHMLGGVASNLGKKPDWFSIFDENMNIISEEDLNKNQYNYEDDKNINNLNGEEFKLGINFEMSKVAELLTSENMGEYLDKARKTVAKNLAANPLYYVENAAFGQEGIGYKKDTPGLKPTEIKGKYVESGYGDETKKEANDKFVEVKESKISFNDLLND